MIRQTICAVIGHKWEHEPFVVQSLRYGEIGKVYRCSRCIEVNKTVIEVDNPYDAR